MTICPIAVAVGCRKCPLFSICPAKGLIGDYRKEEPPPPSGAQGKAKTGRRKPK